MLKERNEQGGWSLFQQLLYNATTKQDHEPTTETISGNNQGQPWPRVKYLNSELELN